MTTETKHAIRLMTATLKSNSGGAEFKIELGTPTEYAHDPGFESSIYVSGQHWDGDHTHPFDASIGGLWLRSHDLMALRNQIINWTNLPLAQLIAEDLTSDFELARLPEQSVHIRFGSRPDTISHLNPVVSITFSAGALRGEFHFVTDQSCLGIFARELSVNLLG